MPFEVQQQPDNELELDQFIWDMQALGYYFTGDENNLYVGWSTDNGFQPGIEDGMVPFQIVSEGIANFKHLPNWRIQVLFAAHHPRMMPQLSQD